MPKKNIKIDDFIDQLSAQYLKETNFGQEYNVELELPKFKVESNISLEKYLQNLGMKIPFTDYANFSNLTQEDELKISGVLQKAFIDVNEKGTEAAAVTVVKKRKGCRLRKEEEDEPKIVRVVCDRPFLFIIDHLFIKNRYLFVTKVADL